MLEAPSTNTKLAEGSKKNEDPTGTKLMPTGIPAEYSERGSPYAENFLFGNAGLSMNDLNNKGIVAFTVKWPKRP